MAKRKSAVLDWAPRRKSIENLYDKLWLDKKAEVSRLVGKVDTLVATIDALEKRIAEKRTVIDDVHKITGWKALREYLDFTPWGGSGLESRRRAAKQWREIRQLEDLEKELREAERERSDAVAEIEGHLQDGQIRVEVEFGPATITTVTPPTSRQTSQSDGRSAEKLAFDLATITGLPIQYVGKDNAPHTVFPAEADSATPAELRKLAQDLAATTGSAIEPPCCIDQNSGAVAPFPTRSCDTLEGRTTEVGHAVEGLRADLNFCSLGVDAP